MPTYPWVTIFTVLTICIIASSTLAWSSTQFLTVPESLVPQRDTPMSMWFLQRLRKMVPVQHTVLRVASCTWGGNKGSDMLLTGNQTSDLNFRTQLSCCDWTIAPFLAGWKGWLINSLHCFRMALSGKSPQPCRVPVIWSHFWMSLYFLLLTERDSQLSCAGGWPNLSFCGLGSCLPVFHSVCLQGRSPSTIARRLWLVS